MTTTTFWAEQHREYLRILGLAQLTPGVQDKVDLSGVIQATMLEACQDENTNDWQPNQRLPWLRRVFLNNLLDALRRQRAGIRDMRREVSIDDPFGTSAAQIQTYLAAVESSPSEKAIRQERADLLLHEIAQLPDDQRVAIEMHHLQELPLAEIATRLNRQKPAVAALIYRGMKKLRQTIDASAAP